MILVIDIRRILPRQSKPAPSKTIVLVPASETVVAGPLEANPVMGPQFVPEAVQK